MEYSHPNRSMWFVAFYFKVTIKWWQATCIEHLISTGHYTNCFQCYVYLHMRIFFFHGFLKRMKVGGDRNIDVTGIKQEILQSVGWHSNHWGKLARTMLTALYVTKIYDIATWPSFVNFVCFFIIYCLIFTVTLWISIIIQILEIKKLVFSIFCWVCNILST